MPIKKHKCPKCNNLCYGELCKKCWTIYTFPKIKENLIKINTGRVPWNKGLKAKGRQLEGLKSGWKNKDNEKNPMWMGDKVGYGALHSWVKRKKKKKKFCENCKKKQAYDLANISGEYKRDLNDWEWLCRGCHMKKDGRINNLKRGR